MGTLTTAAARRIVADLEAEATAWDDAAEGAADNITLHLAAVSRRDKLRDLLRWLPAALADVEAEAATVTEEWQGHRVEVPMG